jgi:hypothetical protein
MISRRQTILGFGSVFVAIVAFLYWNHCNGLRYIAETHSVLLVGYASLLYLHANEHPPHSVDDLFAAGLLLHADDGTVSMPGFASSLVTTELVARVRPSFPESVEGFVAYEDRVVTRGTREEVLCISLQGVAPDRADMREAIRRVGLLWYRVAQGEPTGVPWLNDLMAGP